MRQYTIRRNAKYGGGIFQYPYTVKRDDGVAVDNCHTYIGALMIIKKDKKRRTFYAPEQNNSGETIKYPRDLLEMAWVLIANSYGGDWSKASHEWQECAKDWRDHYHEKSTEQYECPGYFNKDSVLNDCKCGMCK